MNTNGDHRHGGVVHRGWICAAVIGFCCLLLAAPAAAGVPNFIDFQGSLTDGGGNPVTGMRNLTFKLYTAEAAPSAAWEETQSVAVEDGIYAVSLGSVTPLTDGLFANAELWLGITVDGGAEMLPRIRVLAVPYALRAKVAETVDGGVLPPGAIVMSQNANDPDMLAADFLPIGSITMEALNGNGWQPLSADGRPSLDTISLKAAPSGNLLMVLGNDSAMMEMDAGIYNSGTDTWTPADMTGFAATEIQLDDSMRFIALGADFFAIGQNTGMTERVGAIYEPPLDLWTSINMIGAPNVETYSAQAVSLGATVAYVGTTAPASGDLVGGIYDPVANAWSTINETGAPDVASSRHAFAIDGRLLVMGLDDGAPASWVGGIYDPGTTVWTPMNMSLLPENLDTMSINAASNGQIVLLTGWDSTEMQAVGFLYDPVVDAWSSVGMGGVPYMDQMSAHLVPLGSRFVLIGSEAAATGVRGAVYDPAGGAWSAIASAGAPGSIGTTVVANATSVFLFPDTMGGVWSRYTPLGVTGLYYLYMKQ